MTRASPARYITGLAALALAGCATVREIPVTIAQPEALEWQSIVTEADAQRIGEIDAAWAAGLASVQGAGAMRRVAAEGALLDPGAGLPHAALPPGAYHCRIIRLGSPGRGLLIFRPFACHAGGEGELLSLTKQTGSERPGGYLWADGGGRMIFLGAAATGDEALVAYGTDGARDLAGVLERVGAFRYRLAMPSPRSGAKIDILELVPAVRYGFSLGRPSPF